jgi:hypothetical protein
MSLQDIITARLVKALRKSAKPEFDIAPATVLGGIPPAGLGFAPEALPQILAELSGNIGGFGDLLALQLVHDEVDVSTKVSDLAAAILKKSVVKSDAEYEVKISERVRIGLRQVIAVLAGIDEQQVIPTESIERYLPLTDINVDRLRQALMEMLDKYLFSAIVREDIQGTIGRIQRRLTNRMML